MQTRGSTKRHTMASPEEAQEAQRKMVQQQQQQLQQHLLHQPVQQQLSSQAPMRTRRTGLHAVTMDRPGKLCTNILKAYFLCYLICNVTLITMHSKVDFTLV